MNYNIEQGFITELLTSGDLVTVVDSQIKLNFLNGNGRQAFRFIRTHCTKYGSVPSIQIFKKKFPQFELMETDGEVKTGESMQYWCDELRAKFKHNTIVDSMESVLDAIENMDTEEAYKLIKNTVDIVEGQIISSGRLEVSKDTSKRKEAYLKRQKTGGMTGLPTGIEHWDRVTGGLNKEELTALMGYTGVGKSWFLIIVAVHLAKLGYKVLFFTTEMSKEMIMRRVDAVWCGLNYSDFKKGQLKPDQEKAYFNYLEEQEGSDNCLIIEQVVDGVPQIGAKIDVEEPDIVLVDGAYLMADADEDNWMATLQIFRGLHQLVLSKKLPIVATTQSKDETGATLKSLQFAKMLAQECDVVAVLEQDEQMKNDREARLRPLKLREGDLLSSVCINWDFNKMDYSSIYSEDVKKAPDSGKEEATGVITLE